MWFGLCAVICVVWIVCFGLCAVILFGLVRCSTFDIKSSANVVLAAYYDWLRCHLTRSTNAANRVAGVTKDESIKFTTADARLNAALKKIINYLQIILKIIIFLKDANP